MRLSEVKVGVKRRWYYDEWDQLMWMKWSCGVVLPNFFEVGQLDWVEGSRTLGHGDAVPWNRVSHVVVVDQVCERLALVYLLVLHIIFVWYPTIYAGLNVVVFEQVRSDLVNTGSQFLKTVVRQGHATFLRQGSKNLPLFSRLASWCCDLVAHLHSSFSIH